MPETTLARIAELMHAAGITSQQLADQLGVTRPLIHKWLSGQRRIPAHRLRQIEALVDFTAVQPAAETTGGTPNESAALTVTETPATQIVIDPRIERLIELAKSFDAVHTSAAIQSNTGTDAALCAALQFAMSRARLIQGLTQSEIATAIGVSPPLLTLWVKGHRTISEERLFDIARLLGFDFKQEFIRRFGRPRHDFSALDPELGELLHTLSDDAKESLLQLLKSR